MTTATFPPAATAPPAALVTDGRYAFGTYDGPIARINPLDAAGSGLLSGARRIARDFGLKEWEAFQLGDDDHFVLGAVYNAKSLGLLQVLVVDKHAATIARFETRLPSPMLSVARGLSGTSSHGDFAGLRIAIGNEIDDGLVTVDAVRDARGDAPSMALHATGVCDDDEAAHLVIVHPFSDTDALYSHKAMMPMHGSLVIDDERIGFDDDRGFLILDDHHGDYPRPMRYDWITAARRGDTGVVEGFNLTDNQIRDPATYNENAIWMGDTLHRLPPVTFTRPDGPWGPWHARDDQGAVDVTFTPTVRSTMHVGPMKALAEYYAPYGWFSGVIHGRDATLSVDGMFGVGEQKRITI
ncbi:DUF2804 family protein [Gordonia humi]|uniref:DUF2804 family protein n=1 Tax=Gordonia humi TaxID=686429 RepID=A0A840ER17_9ACTN|nr:DUF2804 family protein [Gordonia humi]MBB4134152.1 hypothetical protein [Gordonia humi]